jgi:hypothetical protein
MRSTSRALCATRYIASSSYESRFDAKALQRKQGVSRVGQPVIRAHKRNGACSLLKHHVVLLVILPELSPIAALVRFGGLIVVVVLVQTRTSRTA